MDDFEKFFNRSLKFLSYRYRSIKEVKDFLVRKKASASVIARILHKLQEKKFLDDKAFVAWWIEQRTKIKPRSNRFISMELKQKGIDSQLIQETLQQAQSGIQSELERAKELVTKRIRRYTGLEKKDVHRKVGQFLGQKGFDYETIKETIDDVIDKRV